MVKNGMRAIHPGEILREEVLPDLNMSPNALAQALRVPATRIHEIVNERRAVSADTAMRLGRFFQTSAEMWMNLQANYDLRIAQETSGKAIERDVHPFEEARAN